ncbi:MAG TPA: tetratricopeptide repeat protein [Noviherbaspirillum sp.]
MATVTNQRLSNLRALVVDDMAAMRQNVRTQLGQIGVGRVDQASTPDEAISFIRRESYDLILCDYNLNRETNGQQLLEFLRAQNLITAATMFIMITAETSYDLVASAAEFQPDAYMVKPLTGGKLLERIERLLDRQHALRPIVSRLKLKDGVGAVAECDRVLQAQPKWAADVLKIKGATLLELGKPEEAQAVYRQVLKLREDLLWARLGLARCHQAAGELDQAKTLAQEVLEQDGRYIVAYDLLATVAEAQGDEHAALDALNRSYEVVPSARRSRLVGETAYRTGDLTLARSAFERALSHTRNSLTAQPADLLALAQVQVDGGDADAALKLLAGAPKDYLESESFAATQAAVQAQAHVALGDAGAAAQAFERARSLSTGTRADNAALALAKAAFALGREDEAAQILSQAVKADHENLRMVSMARKVLKDAGREHMVQAVVDQALGEVTAILAEANALMRKAQFDASLATLQRALEAMPDNTGVLLAAAQLHLLWMSQKGINMEYVARVNAYLTRLDELVPGSERVAKMHRFLRETLSRASKEQLTHG